MSTFLRQLRPKVNNYLLTVEKGEGYNLNWSLFERLVLKGYPHKTLRKQHRMRPEISALVRQLTYPDLIDASKTKNRPRLRGVQDVIVFINHEQPEDITLQIADRKDMSSTSSKQNSYEVGMVLKIVRYLAQQGYGTEKMVVLTPYLGQLHKLQEALREDSDPILNDLDSYDLVRAGLLPAASAKIKKKPIRLATIGTDIFLSLNRCADGTSYHR
jgi:superfamily I DNA and/or RNA helicase